MAAFVVIGAGIAGASAAYELAKGHAVVILERESQPGYHTTGRSAAVFSEIYGNEIIRVASVASRSFFSSPPFEFAEHALWAPRQMVMVARDDQIETLHRNYHNWVGLVPSICLRQGDDARSVVPMLKPEYRGGALIETQAHDLDVNEIHRGFLQRGSPSWRQTRV